MKIVYLGGGCFWGVEAYFSRIDGVMETKVGYANGNSDNPTYEEVKKGKTGFAEVVKVVYDENKLDLSVILNEYYTIVDPTLLNQQGEDIGTQYRTGIYYVDEKSKAIIEKRTDEECQKYEKSIVTEILPLKNFYEAEEYHQAYLKKNPNGYCHIKL